MNESKFDIEAKKRMDKLKQYLKELKVSDPTKYQELVDAEAAMYQSWLDNR